MKCSYFEVLISISKFQAPHARKNGPTGDGWNTGIYGICTVTCHVCIFMTALTFRLPSEIFLRFLFTPTAANNYSSKLPFPNTPKYMALRDKKERETTTCSCTWTTYQASSVQALISNRGTVSTGAGWYETVKLAGISPSKTISQSWISPCSWESKGTPTIPRSIIRS